MSWVVVAVTTTALSAYGQIQAGKAQEAQMEAAAQQAESDARTQTIERKRALLETLAEQNVGAAAQGRTISSISTLQQEDVRRGKYDETLIKGGAAASASASRAAGSAAKTAGLISAGATIGQGAYSASKIK